MPTVIEILKESVEDIKCIEKGLNDLYWKIKRINPAINTTVPQYLERVTLLLKIAREVLEYRLQLYEAYTKEVEE